MADIWAKQELCQQRGFQAGAWEPGESEDIAFAES
jgi:hypothetical protein